MNSTWKQSTDQIYKIHWKQNTIQALLAYFFLLYYDLGHTNSNVTYYVG